MGRVVFPLDEGLLDCFKRLESLGYEFLANCVKIGCDYLADGKLVRGFRLKRLLHVELVLGVLHTVMAEVETLGRFNCVTQPSAEVPVINASAQIGSPHFNQNLEQSEVKSLLRCCAQELGNLFCGDVTDVFFIQL